jgi:hypothetical protein
MTPEEKIEGVLRRGMESVDQVRKIVFGLVLINVGVFIIAAACLPQNSSYAWNGPISRFVNSRYRWEIPWLVTFGTTMASVGGVVIARRGNAKPDRDGP